MKALILAGGYGTRLRPLTYTRPKHLLPIANRPHIEHVFDLLLRHGVDGVVLLTSYLAESFEDTVTNAARRGLRVEVTHEEEPLGTAGAIKNAEALVGDETFLCFNGDVLTNADLGAIVESHRLRGAEATLTLTPVEDPSAFGVAHTDDEGKVLGFIEKPAPGEAPTNLISAGIYVFEPAILDRIPRGRVYSSEHELFPELVADGTMYALGSDAYWMDIGTPEKYLEANLDSLAGRFPTEAVTEPGENVCVGLDVAQVARDARVSSSCLGRGSVVEENAVVERSVLLPGAQVGSGAVVVETVVGESAKVTSGVEVRNRAIADGEIINHGG
ncbi:MAG: sugar phosphate nucleotidyltransferase [Actinomycetota bacterium]